VDKCIFTSRIQSIDKYPKATLRREDENKSTTHLWINDNNPKTEEDIFKGFRYMERLNWIPPHMGVVVETLFRTFGRLFPNLITLSTDFNKLSTENFQFRKVGLPQGVGKELLEKLDKQGLLDSNLY
jgi:hypothetical protein